MLNFNQWKVLPAEGGRVIWKRKKETEKISIDELLIEFSAEDDGGLENHKDGDGGIESERGSKRKTGEKEGPRMKGRKRRRVNDEKRKKKRNGELTGRSRDPSMGIWDWLVGSVWQRWG
jgi:hypothetical protein